jgi:hypothetical protein
VKVARRWRRWLRWAVAILLVLSLAGGAGWWRIVATPEPIVDVSGGDTGPTIGNVYFGGPDKPGAMRQLLLDRVRATPRGGWIAWATYYFLDQELAQALIDASDRGVRVTLCVEGDPRLESANGAVLAMLRRHGLNGGLTVRPRAGFPFEELSGKLHIKIYAFSYPKPVALVGSFNPSGGTGDDAAAVMAEIGDQDRGHNLLVELTSPGLVGALTHHVALLARNHGTMDRFSAENNRTIRDRDTRLYFYPRLRTEIVESVFDTLDQGDRIWAGISHLKNEAVGSLEDAAERGAKIELLVHGTERRVPQAAIDRLRAAGVLIRRYNRPDKLPMHAKFMVIERDGRWTSYFGSLNFNRNSRLLNDELLVRSSNPQLALALLGRFREIGREVDREGS